MKKYINIKDLSEYLDIKPSTLYDWVFRKKIPYYKIGRLVKFNMDEIEKWVEERKQKVYEY